ncbi:MAG TPA: potassium transporter TrkG [Polyangiaceae bacterium]|nr:potassium transporter TrkG [Polyangiaceae bacterium]
MDRASRVSMTTLPRAAKLLDRSEAVLLASSMGLLVGDFAAPPWWGVSVVLLALTSLLGVAFSGLVLRSSAAPAPLDSAMQTRTLRERVFQVLILGTIWLLIGAKWWVLVSYARSDPSQFVAFTRSYDVVLMMSLPLGVLVRRGRLTRILALIEAHPARLMAASFGSIGLLGSLLLSLPISLQRVGELSFVDNLFMAFSAVCVTGLSVNTVSQTYTLFGQLVLCLLIQVGGLSIMVLSAAIGLLAGGRMRVRSSVVFAGIVDAESISGLRRQALDIVTATLLLEMAGGLLLYSRFSALSRSVSPGLTAAHGNPIAGPETPEWAAIFHAVSAFCNAGFSNFETGLVSFADDPLVVLVTTALILLGGIGFPVIGELWPRLWRFVIRQRRERLSLNTRVCLYTTAALFLGMAGAYLVLEWSASFAGLHPASRLLAAIFHSASCRTAGFNIVDVGAMRPSTLMITCIAMFIGACPGSCAGGIKTTTLAVLFASMRAELRGRPAQLFDRLLPEATLRKAVGVVFTSIGIVALALFALLLIEPHEPLKLAFEVFSAFSTTGLSTGITPALSVPGKLLITLVMYLGRIGPLTLALAFAARTDTSPLRLPSERVQIG